MQKEHKIYNSDQCFFHNFYYKKIKDVFYYTKELSICDIFLEIKQIAITKDKKLIYSISSI